ncbi:hypothetical protein K443DRAFT_675582 [Laccaria amethystina LaAM-08-1]|jgi:hypothetical protein|uniref:Uncharacterized protein n=1 Tax=Laccaria amethystina LaAM-08-1 TaxID=1095629 RepID=A0A0C9XIF0_9AGAR|nr:hypothetical protein K443DRAFT_675582 [Laccaria amethystina LaAM-08-1]
MRTTTNTIMIRSPTRLLVWTKAGQSWFQHCSETVGGVEDEQDGCLGKKILFVNYPPLDCLPLRHLILPRTIAARAKNRPRGSKDPTRSSRQNSSRFDTHKHENAALRRIRPAS